MLKPDQVYVLRKVATMYMVYNIINTTSQCIIHTMTVKYSEGRRVYYTFCIMGGCTERDSDFRFVIGFPKRITFNYLLFDL